MNAAHGHTNARKPVNESRSHLGSHVERKLACRCSLPESSDIWVQLCQRDTEKGYDLRPFGGRGYLGILPGIENIDQNLKPFLELSVLLFGPQPRRKWMPSKGTLTFKTDGKGRIDYLPSKFKKVSQRTAYNPQAAANCQYVYLILHELQAYLLRLLCKFEFVG